MKVHIMLVWFNQWDEYTKQCIESILRNTKWPYNLTIWRNTKENNIPVNIIFNKIIKSSDCEYFVMMNDDVVVTEGWLTRLMEGMLKHPEVAAIGPKTSHGDPQAIDDIKNRRFNMTIDEIEAYGRQVDGDGVKVMDRALNGFCWLLRGSAWKDIGGLDERIGWCGHETKACQDLFKKGWKVAVANTYVHHYGKVTLTKAEMEGDYNRKEDIELSHKICSES